MKYNKFLKENISDIDDYSISDIKLINNSFKTNDDKFFTKEESDGYSYWYESTNPEYYIGHRSFDYVFAVPNGIESAVKILNKIRHNEK